MVITIGIVITELGIVENKVDGVIFGVTIVGNVFMIEDAVKIVSEQQNRNKKIMKSIAICFKLDSLRSFLNIENILKKEKKFKI